MALFVQDITNRGQLQFTTQEFAFSNLVSVLFSLGENSIVYDSKLTLEVSFNLLWVNDWCLRLEPE